MGNFGWFYIDNIQNFSIRGFKRKMCRQTVLIVKVKMDRGATGRNL